MKRLKLKTKKCLQCGKKIKLKIKRDIWRKKFCCRSCSSKYYNCFKGIWDNPEIVEKMKRNMRKPKTITPALRNAQKERGHKRKGTKINSDYLICKYCGKKFYIPKCRNNGKTGKNGQKQIRQYCSDQCRTLASRKPDELKADKTRLKEWRLKVLKRDNYTCQECNCKKKRLLMAHHIKSKEEYPELVYDINNGKTLCVYCHIKKHPKLENFILSSLKLKLNKPYASKI